MNTLNLVLGSAAVASAGIAARAIQGVVASLFDRRAQHVLHSDRSTFLQEALQPHADLLARADVTKSKEVTAVRDDALSIVMEALREVPEAVIIIDRLAVVKINDGDGNARVLWRYLSDTEAGEVEAGDVQTDDLDQFVRWFLFSGASPPQLVTDAGDAMT